MLPSFSDSYDSDHDYDDDLTPSRIPGQDATIAQIREVKTTSCYKLFMLTFCSQALKREQLKNQRLVESHTKLLEAQGRVETHNAPSKKGKKSKSDSGTPPELVEHVDRINCLGKKCAVMLAIWVPDEIFEKKRPLIDYMDSKRRYDSAENQEMSLMAEIYDFLPEEYHNFLLGLPKFSDVVCDISLKRKSNS